MDYGNAVSYLVLNRGTDVLSSDGARIGRVEHVLADDEEDIFDGLVIDTDVGRGGLRFVDAEQVGDIFERAVVLTVSAADAEQLPEPRPAPAVMDAHAGEGGDDSLERKLRRAWEHITGNY